MPFLTVLFLFVGKAYNTALAILAILGGIGLAMSGQWYGGLIFLAILVSCALLSGEITTGVLDVVGYLSYHAQAWSIAIKLTWLAFAGVLFWIARSEVWTQATEYRGLCLFFAVSLVITNGPLLVIHWGKFRKMTTIPH